MEPNMMPKSRETEAILVGGCISNEHWFEEAVDILDRTDFTDGFLRKIWTALEILFRNNKRFDLPTIAEAIDPNAMDDIIKNHLIPLSIEGSKHLGSWNVVEYANKIRELSERRKLVIAGQEIMRIAMKGEYGSNRELFDQAERVLSNVEPENKKENGLVSLKDLALPYFDNLERLYAASKEPQPEGIVAGPITGTPTGWPDLDAFLCGYQEANFVVIAARPAMGKTAFLLNAGLNVSRQTDTYFAFFSLEMDKDRGLMDRIVSSKSNIDLHILKSGLLEDDHWPRLTTTIGNMDERFLVTDASGMTVTYIKREVRRLRRIIGPKAKLVVGIDYLQRITKPKGMSRYDFVTETAIEMKEMARENKCTVIGLSQLSRDVEKRSDKRPQMSDIRESGQIEQEADVVAFLYRDDYYDKESQKKGITEVIIAKNRNAPTGLVELVFLKNYQKFVSLERATR